MRSTATRSTASPPVRLIEATEGDLLEVRVHNDNVEAGVSVHWHGVDVPNAEDGVAGVTQDAIAEGEDHVYRFVVDDPGTFWYHSHQVSHTQVLRGLFGPLVVKHVGRRRPAGLPRRHPHLRRHAHAQRPGGLVQSKTCPTAR